jgi:hypothetical protein
MTAVTPSTPNYVAAAARLAWPNLPTLLLSDWVISLAFLCLTAVTPGVSPTAVILWVVVVAPPYGALLAQINDMAAGRTVSLFSIFTYLRRYTVVSLSVWMVPAFCGAVTLVGLEWWKETSSNFALLAISVAGSAMVVCALGAIVGLPIAIRDASARGVPLFVLSLHIAARRPAPVIAVVSVAVMGIWCASSFSLSIIVLVPAILSLVNYAAAWTAASALDMRPYDTTCGL